MDNINAQIIKIYKDYLEICDMLCLKDYLEIRKVAAKELKSIDRSSVMISTPQPVQSKTDCKAAPSYPSSQAVEPPGCNSIAISSDEKSVTSKKKKKNNLALLRAVQG